MPRSPQPILFMPRRNKLFSIRLSFKMIHRKLITQFLTFHDSSQRVHLIGGGGVRERGHKDEEQPAFGRKFMIRNLLRLEGGGQFVPVGQFGKC